MSEMIHHQGLSSSEKQPQAADSLARTLKIMYNDFMINLHRYPAFYSARVMQNIALFQGASSRGRYIIIIR